MIKHSTPTILLISRCLSSTSKQNMVFPPISRHAGGKSQPKATTYLKSSATNHEFNLFTSLSGRNLKEWYFQMKIHNILDKSKGEIRGTKDIAILHYPLSSLLAQLPTAFHGSITHSIYAQTSDTGEESLIFIAAEDVKGTYEQKINGLWERLEIVVHAAAFKSFGKEFARTRPKELRGKVEELEKLTKEVMARRAKSASFGEQDRRKPKLYGVQPKGKIVTWKRSGNKGGKFDRDQFFTSNMGKDGRRGSQI